MNMEILEVPQPHNGWWVKQFKNDVTLTLLVFLLLFIIISTRGMIFKYTFLASLLPCLLGFMKLLLQSHHYENTYRITFYDDCLEAKYMSLLGMQKRKYRYDRLEVIRDKNRDIGQYVLFRDKLFIGRSLTLANIYGWSEDKQCQFLEMISSKDVQINNRLR